VLCYQSAFVGVAGKPVGKPDALVGHVRFDERGRETTGCPRPRSSALPRLYANRRWPPTAAPFGRCWRRSSRLRCRALLATHRSGRRDSAPEGRKSPFCIFGLPVSSRLPVDDGRKSSVYGLKFAATGVAVTPDGRRAVSASGDHTLKVWDLASGAIVAGFTCDDPALCCAFAVSGEILGADAAGRLYLLRFET
jgi:hypothetical protein